jgi:hypothetical protein
MLLAVVVFASAENAVKAIEAKSIDNVNNFFILFLPD